MKRLLTLKRSSLTIGLVEMCELLRLVETPGFAGDDDDRDDIEEAVTVAVAEA